VLRRRQLLPVNIVDDVEGRVADEQPA
jgi:hypothetical protein